MRLELEKSWETKHRLEGWAMRSYQAKDEAATLRLERVKGKGRVLSDSVAEQQAIATKRAQDNARLEREIAERKAGAVSYEEYLRQKESKKD